MGEWSKRIGENGEDVSTAFLEQIGWEDFEQGFDIPCLKASKHSEKGKRTSHGIDRLFVYKNPMANRQLMHAVISVKATAAPYPGTPGAKFRDYMSDLSDTTECYAKSEHKSKCSRRFSNVSDAAIAGVLLWFSLSASDRDASIVLDVATCKIDNSHNIFVVDNAQASFLVESITYAERRHGNQKAEFFYFNNGRNFDQSTRLSRGRIMPIEYLNATIIPMAFETVTDTENAVHFVLTTSERFSEQALHRIMGLAKDMTQALASTIVILFPDYFAVQHDNVVRAVKSSFSENDFTNRCLIENFSSDFRKI